MGSWQGSQLMVAKPAIASSPLDADQFTHQHLLSMEPNPHAFKGPVTLLLAGFDVEIYA